LKYKAILSVKHDKLFFEVKYNGKRIKKIEVVKPISRDF